MSTYSVVVALHIIAVVAAYGLPLTAPLLVPYVRRHHPAALPGLHAAQYRLNNVVTGPGTVARCSAFGIYLASDGHRWDEPFVGDRRSRRSRSSPSSAAAWSSRRVRRLAALDPSTRRAYERVYRRYMAAESFLGAVVLLTIFAMAAKPFS